MKSFFLASLVLAWTQPLLAAESNEVLSYLEEIKVEEIDFAIERAKVQQARINSELIVQTEIVQNLEKIVERTGGHGEQDLDQALVRLIVLQNSQRSIQYEIRANELRAEIVRTLQKLRTGETVEPGRVEALRLEDRNVRCEILKLDLDSAMADLELQRRREAIYYELAHVKRAVPLSEWRMFAPKIVEIEANIAAMRDRVAMNCAR